jgi:hypothetical protein
MKRKYIITESQSKLLSENIGELLFYGCVTGGVYGLVSFMVNIVKDNKRSKERLERLQNSIDLIFEMVKMNEYKTFSVDICELKDKSVNFIQKYGDGANFPIQIKEAKYTCFVQPQENKFFTKIYMKGIDLKNNNTRNITLGQNLSSRNVEFNVEGEGFFGREVENNKLLNYITNDLKFPIGDYRYGPKTKIKTDF